MVKVSIIIPVYNVERYLEECMESVLGQTLKEIEIICVNDGSSDGSPGILKEYARRDKRVILIDQENWGYGYAMNRGIERASGEYIGIVEPDDYVSLSMYAELYQKAKEYSLDLVKADFYRFKRDRSGSMQLYYNHLSPDIRDYHKVFNSSTDPDTLRYIMNTWSGIYRREFIVQNHIRHNETPGASFQDNGFFFQTFIYARRGMILDRPYYMNRRDNPDSSINSPEKVYCINVEYDYIRKLLLKDSEIWERFKYMYWFKKYHNYMGTLRRIKEEYKREYLLRFSEELKRGMALGELDKHLFSKASWRNIQSITAAPEQYYLTRVYPETMNRKVFEEMEALAVQNQKLKDEIASIRRSKTFRIGKLFTSVPGKMLRLMGRRR